jgi:hypothetical protein
MSVLVSGVSAVVVGIMPTSVKGGAEGFVARVNSCVDDANPDSVTAVAGSVGGRSTDHGDTPLGLLVDILNGGVVDDGGGDGDVVLFTEGELSLHVGQLGQGLSIDVLDEDDVGSPELLGLDLKVLGDGNVGSLSGTSQSLEGGDKGIDLGVPSEGLKGGVILNLFHDLGQLKNDIQNLSGMELILKRGVNTPTGDERQDSGKNDEDLHFR